MTLNVFLVLQVVTEQSEASRAFLPPKTHGDGLILEQEAVEEKRRKPVSAALGEKGSEPVFVIPYRWSLSFKACSLPPSLLFHL